MKKLVVLAFLFPAYLFSQSAESNYTNLAVLNERLKAVFVDKTDLYINITDSVFKMPGIFRESETADSSYSDSVFVSGFYVNNADTFTVLIRAVKRVDHILGLDDYIAFMDLLHNGKKILDNLQVYKEIYLGKYAEETHIYMINYKGKKYPHFASAKYTYFSFIPDAPYKCEAVVLHKFYEGKYVTEVIKEINKFLREYDIPREFE